jgi:hypothetical protein
VKLSEERNIAMKKGWIKMAEAYYFKDEKK